jgi:RHS repeat-associated protein
VKPYRSLPSLVGPLALLLSTTALAQTGVGDDRVSLPDGPGSRDGLGDNASVNPNMGQMTTAVEVEVPEGFAGVTPSVGLSYSSGAGNSVVGLGWSMAVPFIERMTSRGYPGYTAADRFVVDGSEQLVRVSAPDAEPAVYRARFEGGFVRYRWFERAEGAEGYWTAEYPDGLVATFGASADGELIPESRVGSDEGTFRYLMTSMVDRFGHEMRYDYQLYGTTSLLDQISYVFTTGAPRYRVSFEYEPRADIQSDARGGFLEEIADRLTFIDVFSGNTRISRYALDYEDYTAAGGASRLQRVRRFGKDGGLFPIVQSFEYSKALGGVCDDNGDARNCKAPYLVDMGELGVSLQSRTANLIDLNGDSLPDVVDTAVPGAPMRIFLNRLNTDGTQEFVEKDGGSAVLRDSSGFALDSSKVQMLDVDGDGFVDLINQQLGRVLKNKGAGDWDSLVSLAPGVAGTIPDFGDFNASQDGDLSNVRFLDANGDRRIDVLRTSPDRTEIFLNDGNGGYEGLAGVELMGDDGSGNGWDFATTANLELADMNGDGLLDPVRILQGRIDYQLNLGFGRWTAVQSVTDLPFSAQNDVDALELEDINGDGLDDAVVVSGSTVRFAINRNGARFDAVTTIDGVGNESLPERLATTSVLYADMNGNGSNDVVWITASGGVTFLELFPVRPNLLTKIENGLGLVTEVTYGTAAEQRARSTDPASEWPDPIPTQMLVVTSMETYAQTSDPAAVQHAVMSYAYQAGFYDGDEKQFRGFSRVTQSNEGDASQQALRLVSVYDTGAGFDRAQMAGLLLHESIFDDDGPVTETTQSYDLCAVADLPAGGLDFPIRFVCRRSVETIEQRGGAPAEWATTRAEYDYDGYGNQIRVANLGVTKIGDGGCPTIDRDPSVFGAPSGPDCLGDEAYVESDYVLPTQTDGAWMLNLVRESRGYGRPGSDVVRTVRYFYDGPAFVGLSGGGTLATHGLVSRTAVRRVVGGPFEDVSRAQYDEHGNVIDALGALGAVDSPGFHVRTVYDEDHLSPISTTRTVVTADGSYDLKRITEYDPLFGNPVRATDDFIVGAPGDDTSTLMAYDEFGRLVRVAAPGDTLEAPTETFSLEYGNPISRIVTRTRSVRGAAPDMESISCMNGLGQAMQSATKVDDDRYIVTGAGNYNRIGKVVRSFQAFETNAANACAAPPADVSFDDILYSATGEELQVVRGDSREYGGTASRTERRYHPLSVEVFDEDDTDAASPTRNVPGVMRLDGLGRVSSFQRRLDEGAAPETYTITYDELGNLRGYIDPDGNEKIQTYDLTGRRLTIVDPDRGTATLSYDAGDRLVRVVDGNGTVTRREYDSLDRLVAEYDEARPDATRTDYFFDKHPNCAPAVCTNGAGQLVGVRYPLADGEQAVESYAYDARGNLVRTSRRLGEHAFDFALTYDNADRVIEQVFPGDQAIRYVYDDAMHIVAIPGFIDEARYDDRGQLTEVRYANGTVEKRSYDSILRPLQIETHAAGGDAIVSLEFARNRRGNITGVRDNSVGRGAGIYEATYGYDGHQRLVRAALGKTDDPRRDSLEYQYSVLNNLLGKTSSRGADSAEHVGSVTYGAGRPHAVARAGDVDHVVDDVGNVVARGAFSFEYDHNQRLTAVHRGQEQLAQYFFDATDNRVLSIEGGARVYEPAVNFEVRDGISRLRLGVSREHTVEIRSTALQTELLPDVVANGRIDAADAFASIVAGGEGAADELLRGSARRLLLGDSGRQTRFFAVDQAGSVIAVTDDAGALTERIAYHPYGSVREASAGRTEYATWTGRSFDDVTGFVNFGPRFYSPAEGRFVSTDGTFEAFGPAALEAMVDATVPYGYGGANPINSIDPSGRIAMQIGGVSLGALTLGVSNVVGAVIGGGVALASGVLKLKASGSWSRMTRGEKAVAAVALAGDVALSAFNGFITSGLSAVGEAIMGGVEVKIAHDERTGGWLAQGGRFLGLKRKHWARVAGLVLGVGAGNALSIAGVYATNIARNALLAGTRIVWNVTTIGLRYVLFRRKMRAKPVTVVVQSSAGPQEVSSELIGDDDDDDSGAERPRRSMNRFRSRSKSIAGKTRSPAGRARAATR